MKKYLFLILLIPILLISGCKKKQHAILLLNDNPINTANYRNLEEKPTFKVRQKIYFLLAAKEPIESNMVRLQVIKVDNKYGYNISQVEIALGTDLEVGESKHIISDSFALHQEGNYFIRIFAINRLHKPLAESEFTIGTP
jgi:PBP1b-binding outer membrane lipoprotein LpoB